MQMSTIPTTTTPMATGLLESGIWIERHLQAPGWETWGNAIVTAGCLPCVDVDHELGDNAGNIQHTWDQDSKAKGYFQFSSFHGYSCFLLDALRWPARQFPEPFESGSRSRA